jgi:hypothetical protein
MLDFGGSVVRANVHASLASIKIGSATPEFADISENVDDELFNRSEIFEIVSVLLTVRL